MLDPHKRQSKIGRLADVNCGEKERKKKKKKKERKKEKPCMSLATIMSTPRGGADCMYTGREDNYAHAHRTVTEHYSVSHLAGIISVACRSTTVHRIV